MYEINPLSQTLHVLSIQDSSTDHQGLNYSPPSPSLYRSLHIKDWKSLVYAIKSKETLLVLNIIGEKTGAISLQFQTQFLA